MDRRRSRAHQLAALGAVLLAATAALAQASAPLRAARWLAPGSDPVAALSREPTECLALPAGTKARLSVEIGRAAFRSPTLLGGQAARAGVTCESCHRSGRTNPDFLFPGVSGAPGTADVTSSLFSSHRGDGVANPRPIPDLSAPKAALKVDQDPASPALVTFIHGLITQEFDGPEPPAAVLKGLADYVRALSPAACPAAAQTAVTLTGLMEDARRAIRAAEALAQGGDTGAAVVLVQAARARLFLIDERYAAPALAPDRARLRRADAELAGAAQALRDKAPDAAGRLARWTKATPCLEAALARHEAQSAFNPGRLAAGQDGRLPRKPS